MMWMKVALALIISHFDLRQTTRAEDKEGATNGSSTHECSNSVESKGSAADVHVSKFVSWISVGLNVDVCRRT